MTKMSNEEERAVLADFVSRPKETKRHAQYFLVTEEPFKDHLCGTVWRELQASKSTDQVRLMAIVSKELGFGNDAAAKDAFLDLQSSHEGEIQVRLHDLAMKACSRQIQAAMTTVAAMISDCADGESYESMIKFAIEAIPKPPKLPCSREEMLSNEDRGDAELPEIPARLLHVPGFIDTLVDYSLAAAYKPNRTLSFAGALALLAHLAGRKYYDKRRTRTNLFVCAIAGTGGGKEWPRAVNNATSCRPVGCLRQLSTSLGPARRSRRCCGISRAPLCRSTSSSGCWRAWPMSGTPTRRGRPTT